MDKELHRHKQYLRMANIWSEESYCNNLKVGVIIVKNGMIISDGYNGTPQGMDNKCEDDNCKTLPYVLHAEANAITKLCKHGGSSDGADIYTTHSPCIECAKLIIQSGIKRVFYIEKYRNTDGLDLLDKVGVKVRQLSFEEEKQPHEKAWVLKYQDIFTQLESDDWYFYSVFNTKPTPDELKYVLPTILNKQITFLLEGNYIIDYLKGVRYKLDEVKFGETLVINNK